MDTNKLLTGNIYKPFAKYVSLNILSMIGLSCYILADTFFIANGVGAQGLTALNLVLPAFSLLTGTGMLLGMGAATRFAILKGEGQRERQTQCLPARWRRARYWAFYTPYLALCSLKGFPACSARRVKSFQFRLSTCAR